MRVACLDFSARSTPSPRRPSADALWLATERPPQYSRTRAAAWAAVAAWARQAHAVGEPAILGVDFALGFPAGTAAAAGFAGWAELWQWLGANVADADNNANNRFEVAAELNRRVGHAAGPWWGCPASAACDTLSMRRGFDWPFHAGDRSLARLRRTDAAHPGTQEVWKLAGVGSVGSQTLLGLAGLWRLKADQPDLTLRLWPMESNTPPGPGEVVVVEAFPAAASLLPAVASRMEAGMVRDAAQTAAWREAAKASATEAAFRTADPPEAGSIFPVSV